MNNLSCEWEDPSKNWPVIAYISTSNLCPARCISCVNHRVKVPRGLMSLENFKQIADKIKAKGIQIGAMFCFGEPLTDPTLFEKYAYAIAHRGIDVLAGHVSLSTNSYLLTEEKWPKLLEWTSSITLTFFNVEEEFERITGLPWKVCYENAIGFIDYIRERNPLYEINVGVNSIPDLNLEKVKQAFAGKQVNFLQDTYYTWNDPVITGPTQRLLNDPSNRCDGHRGVLQIMWNGDCFSCAFDMTGNEQGVLETRIGNILTDTWEQLESNFRTKWKEGFSLCRRCDYWHQALSIINNGGQLPNPLPLDWNDWKAPYYD
jgi:MoaA/NifB/PqqE/SkfB family radical SAM enzyme